MALSKSLRATLPESQSLKPFSASQPLWLAENFSILGAASNIIIIQNSEKRGIKGFGFLEFLKIGAPLTLLNILIYEYYPDPGHIVGREP